MNKIQYYSGDVFSLLDLKIENREKYIVFPHVVNIHNVFGAGLALAFANKFPGVKQSYHRFCSENKEIGRDQVELFGQVDYYHQEDFTVCNMFAQTLGGDRPIYYNHLARCMDDVASFVLEDLPNTQIVTVKFGAGLAKGDWKVIEQLINDCWIRNEIEVTVCVPN